MTIKEIKDLTKFLTDEEVEKIKQEIKSKEDLLKKEDLDEEELGQVLNTLFAILVIEAALESEIEGIEEIRAELELELLESYKTYDAYMLKFKKEEKKKKKNWLLNFLLLGDRIHTQKRGLSASERTINSLKNELATIKQQKSDANLKAALKDRNGPRFKEFCDLPHECDHPHHHKDHFVHKERARARRERQVRDVVERKNTRISVEKIKIQKIEPKSNPSSEKLVTVENPNRSR